jgi:hypothetical protein
VGAEEALGRGDRGRLAGREFEVRAVIHGPDVRTGFRACVRGQHGKTHEVALSDLEFRHDRELRKVAAAYQRRLRWQ